MNWRRLLRHIMAWRPSGQVLSPAQSDALAAQVQTMESKHRAEVRICIERRWPLRLAVTDVSQRERALHWFALDRVWDTEDNTGVLVYACLADRAIEIVADRGLTAHIQPEQWQALIHTMRASFSRADYFEGLARSLEQLQELLDLHLPAAQRNPNELSDRPIIR